MGHYDEFGRPIYETAEEYNKARKAASKPRTYDSPEGAAYQHNPVKENYRYQSATQRHVQQEGAKKAKKIILVVIIFIIMVNVGIVFSLYQGISVMYDEIHHEYEEDWVHADDDDSDGYGEYIGDDTVPLPEGFETFSYNGYTVTLPTSYEEIAQLGLYLEKEYDENELIPDAYEELLNLCNENGMYMGMIRINNYSGAELPLGKCVVDYFFIENPAAYNDDAEVTDFIFGDGLTFESTYEDLEAYFGVPYYHYEDHSGEDYNYDSYQWQYYGDEEIHFVNIVFWDNVISHVDIEKRSYEEKY